MSAATFPQTNHPPPTSLPNLVHRHDPIQDTTRVMRRCFSAVRSSYRTWDYRTLRTSPKSRPRAIKQLSNAELLSLVQESKQDTASPQDDQSKPSDTGFPQSSSCLTLRQQLPQSPLIDPQLSAARIRHRAEKPPPSGERSPFQLKLQKNPYGMPSARLHFLSPSSPHL